MSRETILAGCTGKTGFLTWEQAKGAVSSTHFRPKKRNGEGAVRPYRCRFCGHWHIGTSSLEGRKGRRK